MENNFKMNEVKKTKEWSVGRIFWGLLLVLIGSMLITSNFGFAHINWSSIVGLWPFFIIAAGLSVLSLHNMVWKILSVILAVFALVAIAVVALGDSHVVSSPSKQIDIDKNGIHITVE
jgi:cytochrome c oxidase subunit IV